ncbi:MAG: hypothetical protein ACP5G0_08835 [Desulfomonilia bacterium]
MDQRQILYGILKNKGKSMYKEFFAYAQKRGVDESVRFLENLTNVVRWSQRPISGLSQGVYATFVKEGSFWEVNLPHDIKMQIKGSVDEGMEPDWGPAAENIEHLLITNNVVRDWLMERKQKA